MQSALMSIQIRVSPMSSEVGFAEVQYYFRKRQQAYAMVKKYSNRDEQMYQESSGTIWSCRRQDQLTVLNVTCILSVVAMVPHVQADGRLGSYDGPVFVVEKLELDVMPLTGFLDIFFDDVEHDDPEEPVL